MTWLQRRIPLHTPDSPAEERANWITHLVGTIAALAGTAALLARRGGHAGTAGYLVFGLTMVFTFAASTLYHASPTGSDRRRFFLLADHVSIFLLIAGTYTPIMSAVGTRWAYGTLVAVWILAGIGVALKVVWWKAFRRWQVAFFLLMGWLAVVRLDVVLAVLPNPVFVLILTGGIIYSVGTVFYSRRSLPFNHAIWHLFVIGGAGSFYWGVYGYL
jgi:hemolysin III